MTLLSAPLCRCAAPHLQMEEVPNKQNRIFFFLLNFQAKH